ncbi:hypothetical protein PV379_02500 [Streptomyces caniscabiei]|uniref:hypothetical protein n=1 Tax=Streptomyces caniscabiei TaxID=2746961 RepID=UPI0029A0ED03|nr:hypothetical protein [Streptomyces caniscabiei]MDX2776225.1 hypothetical protein [Streptomyces caniscabiei]
MDLETDNNHKRVTRDERSIVIRHDLLHWIRRKLKTTAGWLNVVSLLLCLYGAALAATLAHYWSETPHRMFATLCVAAPFGFALIIYVIGAEAKEGRLK